ncbi:MAG: peptide ABC transporter substrate-binding protein [Dehalococcoidia bacterium]
MRRPRLRRSIVLPLAGVVVLALAAVAVACGGGTSSPAIPTSPGEASPTAAPITGGEALRLPGPDPITLDPALASDAGSAQYIVEIFSGLVTLDRDLQVVPDIAESIDVSPDGTVYTFKLRTDALFHNLSRRVTADDFKYSLERALRPETQSTTALLYLGDIVGAREFARDRADEVTGIKVIDPNTLQITIDAPKPYFLAKMTYPVAYVVDRNQVENNPRGWTRRPIGTGPYMLREWRLGERIRLEAFDRYYQGPPSVDQAVFLLAGGSPLTMYENNEIDITGIGLNDIERIRDPREPLNREFISVDDLDIWYVGFNATEPPFDDVKVRQAFTHAIDKDLIVEVVLLDAVRKADGVLPPDMPGYNPNLLGLEFDADLARQLLGESEYGGPEGLPPIVLTATGQGATIGPSSEAIIAMWEDNLGVRVEIQQVEFATFLQQLRRGDFQMFQLGWIADYVDPEDFLDIKFHSQSGDNDSRYSNPEVDRLLEQARTEQDTEQRLALYQEAEQLIVNDAAWIPLYHTRSNVLIKPWVKGYTVAPMVVPILRYVRIER